MYLQQEQELLRTLKKFENEVNLRQTRPNDLQFVVTSNKLLNLI